MTHKLGEALITLVAVVIAVHLAFDLLRPYAWWFALTLVVVLLVRAGYAIYVRHTNW